VDFVLVATDDEYAKREASKNLFYAGDEFTDDMAHQVGGYILDRGYLLDAAERGDKRTRFQFVKAQIVFSCIADLEQIVGDIATYPEQDRVENMKSFYSQLPLHFSFMELAEYSQNAYLLSETAVARVLFGGRLIPTHNTMLYRAVSGSCANLKKPQANRMASSIWRHGYCAVPVLRMQKHFVTALPITSTGHGQKREPGIASMKITSGTGGTANSHRQSANPLHVRIKILGRSSSCYDCLARQTG
jgi:hypothetical protein